MTNLLFYVAAFLVVLCVLIFVHELGHFLAARACGVKVLRFSIGFGPVLRSWRLGRDRTEWAVSVVPLGGYVKMLDEREGKVEPGELPRAFNRQGVAARSLIVAAGPLANFVMAIFLYWAVFLVGSHELLPLLGAPAAGTPAAVAGFESGQQVRKVAGVSVETWSDFRWLLLQKAAEQESVDVETIDDVGNVAIHRLDLAAASENGWEGDALERLGVVFFRPAVPAIVGKLIEGGAATRAGLLEGDHILAVDAQPVVTWFDFVLRIRQSPGIELRLDVQRAGQQIAVSVTPEGVVERGVSVGKIGAAVAESGEGRRELRTYVRYGVMDAASKAMAETWDKSVFTLVMMGKMLVGEVSWRNLSGPVTIADYAGQSARLGIDYYLRFMALVSISLGVLNLLPIPILDGGHLMYHMIEVVRRRPLSERAMEIGQQIGMSLLFVLMAFAFFNDITRLISG